MGLYPHNHGVMLNTHIAPAWCRGLSPDTPTFSTLLKDRGYNLDYVGKWHVHQKLGPAAFGFDRHVFPRPQNDAVPGTEIVLDFAGHPFCVAGTSALPKEKYGTWQLFDRGIDYLRDRAKSTAPFFLRIDTPAPHFRNIVPEPYASLYNPESIPAWPNFEETFAGKPAGHLRKYREWHLEDRDWDWWSRVVALYYADVTLIDDCVGRLLNALDEQGVLDRTVVILTCDHGDALGSHRHFEKAGTMYDEIYRIPLLVRVPGGRRGSTDAFVRLMDLMPTLCELAGARAPDGIDAISLMPLLHLTGLPDNWYDSVYTEHHGEVWGYQSQRMVRTHRWKYVYNPHDTDELYDLETDAWEMRNLADDSSAQGVLREMKARLLGWNDATGDMFQWDWVRWNFPEPAGPHLANKERLPLTGR